MGRLLKFDSLITPAIIKTVFYVLVGIYCLIAFFAVVALVFAGRYAPVNPVLGIIGVALGLLVSIVFARIVAEMVLVIFMIRDELAWQRVNAPPPFAPGLQ